MPTRDQNLLFALLTLRAGAVPAGALLDAVARGLDDPAWDLAESLVASGLLPPTLRGGLAAEAERLVRTKQTRPASGTIAFDPGKTLPLPPPTAPGAPDSSPRETRYTLGAEIGRGGLGRVVEAVDGDLGRTVALKVLLHEGAGDILARFQREGRITAQLEHPNIVPVHDTGVLAGEVPRVFFSMKRITGRDMAQVIGDLRAGKPGPWTLRRLVEAFRDVCRAMAFAHSKGVIHRDLKPSNVMLGEFGEVLVVDWGLAKVRGEEDVVAGRLRAVAALSGAADLTMEGEVLGTPSYMPPEQAEGHISEVDERSDVYSLGAILYEILTWRPPHEGRDALDTLRSVRTTAPKPPSTVLAAPGAEAATVQSPADAARAAGRWSVPPELEAICLKALARNKQDRYAGAAVLSAEIEAWLEGAKERERRERLAAGHVERAFLHLEIWRQKKADAERVRQEMRREHLALEPGSPPEKRRAVWALEDRMGLTESDGARALASATSELSAALSNVERHPEARRLFAELHWERFLEAETAEDPREMVIRRQAAEEMNDGVLDTRLRGEGTLEVRTRAYPCSCLSEGRPVSPAELSVCGFHPWSGRRLHGYAADCCPELEAAEPVVLRVHAAACRPSDLGGARVWAWKYEEREGALVPETPPGVGEACPAAVLDALFGDSPYRPRGPGLFLGSTPIRPRPWPMGSWLLVVDLPGRTPMRVPFSVGRMENAALDVTLFAPDEIPAGFHPMAAGRFRFQGDRGNPATLPLQTPFVDDVFFSTLPVTVARYLAFLNDLDPPAALPLVPRGTEQGTPAWTRLPAGPFTLSGATRLQHTPEDWQTDWPVCGVPWPGAAAFARWASLRDRRLYTLPHEAWFEKAMRGADGRHYPWGRRFDPARCNTNGSLPGPSTPRAVGIFPTDEGPFGARDLAGNAATYCLNDGGHRYPAWRSARGGTWGATDFLSRATYRSGSRVGFAYYGTAFRLAAPVRLDGAGEGEAWAKMLDEA